MKWETVIGLEVHAQLSTRSKLFSGASAEFGSHANHQTCFIDAALPGVLPVLNQKAVKMAILFGLAVDATINTYSIFERKNYFYPDLPKGYQISQYLNPIISHGTLRVSLDHGEQKNIPIIRAHLEEDAGKSTHHSHHHSTGIDLNRAGTPLLEIVTAPCMNSTEEAILYLKSLHRLVRFLKICDGNMQEGSFRCDVNISLKPVGSETLGTRTEIKNLNSFRFIEKAIAFEQARHQDLLERGHQVTQETRLYDPDTDSTKPLRHKENANDYRYFPDPDLLPLVLSQEWIHSIKKELPDLPETIRQQLKKTPSLNEEDIHFLLHSPEAYDFYKDIRSKSKAPEKLIVNWLKSHYAAALNAHQLQFNTQPVSAQNMAYLLDQIQAKSLSPHHARWVFHFLWAGENDIQAIMKREGYQTRENDVALEKLIAQTLEEFPQQLSEYKAGKDKLLGFFIGQIMKKTKGQASPEQINALVKKCLNLNGVGR